ncbi:MAG: response regulator [Archangiaceae bacterium]|nr:response regulator [Archangiaceae bacterium]
MTHVLLVEDEAGHAALARAAFELAPEFRLTVAGSVSEARAALASTPGPQLVIADLQLPDGRGIELVPPYPAEAAYPVLITTSHGDESIAVEAMKAGALDYFVKSAENLADLPRFAARALREWHLVLERRKAEGELRERERQLDHAQRLEAIGRLATGVAHDFNNLLMGIIGCAELAKLRLRPADPAREYVEELERAARGGTSIAKSLLAFGRRGSHEPSAIAVDEAVGGTEQLLRSLSGEQVRLQLSLGYPSAHVSMARGELEQVLLNLAINARDAMPRGGSLTVRTSSERLEAQNRDGLAAGEYAVLCVSDTGTGMDEATLRHIFEPFFTTKEAGKGTGLGLAMVYGAVRGAGGNVTVDSSPGAGTRFCIRLPVCEALAPRPSDAAPRELPPLTVLLLEDEPRVRMLARHYLEQLGHRVLEAGDGREAREQWRAAAAPIDLLVTDVALPGESGPEVARQLQRVRPGLPVLFMSAHAATALQSEQALPQGAVLLTKPFDRDALARALAAVLPPAVASARTAGRGRLAVLVVEDNAAARMATTELLGDEGFEVRGAASMAEAMKLWGERGAGFDAVVTDLGLPDGGGGAVVAQLRAARPGLPAVYISGRHADDPEVAALVAAPKTRFMGKPFDFKMLAQVLRELADS